jgi:hypothetical protein
MMAMISLVPFSLVHHTILTHTTLAFHPQSFDLINNVIIGFYDSIAAQAIEWEDKKAIHHTASATPTVGGDGRTEAEIRDSEEKALRKFLELIVRKAQVGCYTLGFVS